MADYDRILLVRNFERICCEETTLKDSGYVLCLPPYDECYTVELEHGRICVATVRHRVILDSCACPYV
jgi:hypothetical protein